MDSGPVVIERLTTAHGWEGDRYVKNVVTKEYDSIVGAKLAIARLTFDATNNQYFLTGSFVSAGEDVLAICFACIPNGSEARAVKPLVDDFVADAEKLIAGSYAVRLLRNQVCHT